MAAVFRFVNSQCQFLSALTSLQPRYAKNVADSDSLVTTPSGKADGFSHYPGYCRG
jgi:hypothetical protein